MPTLEEASHCPKCGEAGKPNGVNAGPRGSKVHTFLCMNERCSWLGTGFIVQINADGTIPERTPGPKQFEPLTPGQEAAAERYIEDVMGEDRRNS